jgi:hypothetical protein
MYRTAFIFAISFSSAVWFIGCSDEPSPIIYNTCIRESADVAAIDCTNGDDDHSVSNAANGGGGHGGEAPVECTSDKMCTPGACENAYCIAGTCAYEFLGEGATCADNKGVCLDPATCLIAALETNKPCSDDAGCVNSTCLPGHCVATFCYYVKASPGTVCEGPNGEAGACDNGSCVNL